MSGFADTLREGSSRVSRWFAWGGGALILGSATLITLDVIFRNLVKSTYFESFELSGYAFAISTSFGLAYAFFSKAHIRIEVLYNFLPKKARAWFDVVSVLIGYSPQRGPRLRRSRERGSRSARERRRAWSS